MPRAKVNGAEIYYEEAGSGPPLLLSPGGLQGVLSSYQPVSATPAILILEITTYQAWGQPEVRVWIRAQAP